MNINSELGLQCDIPLQNTREYIIDWSINCHAELELAGDISPEIDIKPPVQYIGTEIELYFIAKSGEKEGTIFKGVISFLRFIHEDGICRAIVKGSSASKNLDIQCACCSFQDVSMTYADIAKKVVSEEGGAVICTAGINKIVKPHIRYQETAWEFIRRMASLVHTYLIPDIITGRPNIWFGMRHGIEIEEELGDWESINIIKNYEWNDRARILTSYQFTSRKMYRIGDYKIIEAQKRVIYKVNMVFAKGELMFRYMLARETELDVQPYFNEIFTGLSLSGKVIKTENESVCIKLDIDGEDGESYFYPWMPETGNALYAMPEVQTSISLYIMSPDERDAFGLRCLITEGGLKHKNSNFVFKEQETITGSKIGLFPQIMEVSKNGNNSLHLDDDDGVNVLSEKKISMDADGRIRMKAKRIMVSVLDKIKFVSEL